jgi:bifunctional DNase/RNase
MFERIENNLEQVKILTILKSESRQTVYLFSKNKKIILPIYIENCPQDRLRENLYTSPSPMDTAERAVNALGGKIVQISILEYRHDMFYAYLTLKREKCHYEVFCSLYDCIHLAITKHCPVFVRKNILFKCGIKVTKELIERSLICV